MLKEWRPITVTGGEGKTFISALNPQPPFLKCNESLIETEDAGKLKGSNFHNAE